MASTKLTAAAVSLGLYIVYRLIASIRLAARRRAIIRHHGCQPAVDLDSLPHRQSISNMYWGIDRFFGLNLGNLREVIDLIAANQFQRGRLAMWKSIPQTKTIRTTQAHIDWILTQDPENVKYIMSTDFDNWALGVGRVLAVIQFIGAGIFASDGPKWHYSRNLLKPNFSRFQVSNMAQFEHHFQRLLAQIPRDGSTVNLAPLFFCYTMDVATEFLYGVSADSQGKDNSEFIDAFEYGQYYVGYLARLGKLSRWLPHGKRFKKARQVMNSVVDRYVDEALERQRRLGPIKQDTSETGRYVMLYEMVKETSDRAQLRAELLAVLLAGRDTTASLLTMIWFIMDSHPDVRHKLEAEVATLGGIKPSFEQLKSMKYLQAVMNETLRLWPPAPFQARVALRDSVLPRGGGPDGSAPLFVPKGHHIFWNYQTYHYQKDIWGDDVEEFRPDRWLGKDGMRHGWHFLTFHGGPRVCLGQQFALTEAGYVTVRLFQEGEGMEFRNEDKKPAEVAGMVWSYSKTANVAIKPKT